MFGQAQAEKGDRRFKMFLHRHDGADRPAFAREGRLPAERELHRRAGGVGVRPLEIAEERFERLNRLDLHVGVDLLDEILDQPGDLRRTLFGHEPGADLGFGAVRHDGLDARAGVSAGDAVNFERRRRHERLQHVGIAFHIRADRFQLVRFLVAFGREARIDEAVDFGFCRGNYIFIKSGYFHLAGLRVVALADHLGQLAYGVARNAPDQPRMHVFGVRLQFEEKTLQPAQAVRGRRLLARNPDRVGDEDRIGLQMAYVPLDEIFEVRRTDLLFEFPDEFEVERQAVIYGVTNGEHRRHRRTFVIGRSTPFVPVALLVESERRFVPFRRVGGLHVKMVIDRHRRVFRIGNERAEDHRETWRRDGLGFGPNVVQILRRDFAAAVDVPNSFGIAADARSFDERGEFIFEFVTGVANVVIEVLIES